MRQRRIHRTVFLVAVLALPGISNAAPSDDCPATSPFTVSQPGVVGVEECFGTVDIGHSFKAVHWNADEYVDLLIGLNAGFGIGASSQSVEIWAGGPGWRPGQSPEILVDHSLWWASSNTHVTTGWGDTDGDGLDEVEYGASNWSSNYCTGGTTGLYETTGALASWGVYMNFGTVALGDVNGDGYEDVKGASEVVLGGPDGAWAASAATLPAPNLAGRLGDVNGDGFDDVRLWTYQGGVVEVFWAAGGPTSIGSAEPLPWTDSLYRVGDVNGDDAADLVRVEQLPNYGGSTATLHVGSALGPSVTGLPLITGPGLLSLERLTSGDVNGDGLSDVLLVHSAWDGSSGSYDTDALLYLGTPAGLAAGPSWIGDFDASIVGDFDGDGDADLIAVGGAVTTPGMARSGVWMLPGAVCPDDLDCDGVPDGSDCAPYTGVASPGLPEACDGWDNDCDGIVDDGWDQDGDGVTTCGGDCDDADPFRSPLVVDICNGIDDDCDGRIDAPSGVPSYDLDQDGTGDLCDCDDNDATVGPDAEEICDNGVDEDCDELVDEQDCVDGSEDEPPGDGGGSDDDDLNDDGEDSGSDDDDVTDDEGDGGVEVPPAAADSNGNEDTAPASSPADASCTSDAPPGPSLYALLLGPLVLRRRRETT